MAAVKFIDGVKLYIVREFAVMRDGTMVVKIMDREGNCVWTDTVGLEVFNND